MKKLFTLLSFMLLGGYSFASPVNEQTARIVAQHFLAQKYTPGIALTLTQTYYNNANVPAMYVFNITNSNGFVIVAGDDAVQPVLAYSAESHFQTLNMPAHLAWWINGYRDQISAVMAAGKEATPAIAGQWNRLLTNDNSGAVAARATGVAPLIATLWDQMPYYNDLCPVPGGDGSATPTGCVATAMAQVMYYWQWPTTGTGSHTYMENDYGSLSANFGATTYDWANMPLSLDQNSTAAQVSAVATLMYHCGVGVEMDYDLAANGGSGALSISYGPWACAESALTDYFGYDASSQQGLDRGNYPDDAEWISILKNSLDQSFPILYGGSGNQGGHEWVIDGYDDNDFFHCNWGWSGLSNGYFTVNSMDPDALGTGGGGGGFNEMQDAIVNIHPVNNTTPPDDDDTPPGDDTTPTDGDIVVNAALNMNVTSIYWNQSFTITSALFNNTGSDFSGDYTAAIYRASDNSFVSYIQTFNNQTIQTQTAPDVSFSTSGIAAMTPGQYYARILYRKQGGSTQWTPVPVADNEIINRVNITVLNNSSDINDISLADLIQIYPNPAEETVHIDLDRFVPEVKAITLFNIQGQAIRQVSVSNRIELSVSDLSSGVYFIRLDSGAGAFTKKIVVKH